MAENNDKNRIFSLIILSFLIICIPIFLAVSLVIAAYALWFLTFFLRSPTVIQGLLVVATLLTASLSFYVLYRLVKWLRK
jgi:hypothetical protein